MGVVKMRLLLPFLHFKSNVELDFRTTAPTSMTTLASVTATDPKEVVQEVTNAITMLTVLTEKKTMSVLAMMITLEMDSPVQVVKRQDWLRQVSKLQ